MTTKDKTTEEKILQAAEKVFVEKGFDGARMQEIADQAGINKALLHYYYRNKEKLFAEAFQKAIRAFFPQAFEIFNRKANLFDKIRLFTKEYIELMEKNPILPMFILNELQRNRMNLSPILEKVFAEIKSNALENFREQIRQEIDKGTIRPIKAEELIINIVSLCMFPFIAMPIINFMFMENNPEKFHKLTEERKTSVAEFIINSIKY